MTVEEHRTRPSHPMGQMVALLVVVTLLIVVLAVASV